jgi:hypothetical protein
MTPRRIQRKRTRGWKMPENTVYVGRPTKYGNPYNWQALAVSEKQGKKLAAEYYKEEIHRVYQGDFEEIKTELRGKNLACWCKEGEPCHADILLKIANS